MTGTEDLMLGYAAAIDRAAVGDRSDRLRLEFAGREPAQTLNGILTNDISTLAPERGLYAAALTPKGKVIADVRVFALPDRLLVDASRAAAPGLLAMLKRFVNPRLATIRDVSAETACLTVIGPAAAAAVSRVSGIPVGRVEGLGSFDHAGSADGLVTVIRTPELGVPAFDLVLPASGRDRASASLTSGDVVPASTEVVDMLRIEAGWPAWGRDMDDAVLAQEAGLDRLGAISFNKGCYTGQETVARVHFRGHVNRVLRGLRASDSLTPGSPLARLAEGQASGGVADSDDAQPKDDARPKVGEVRSTARSPRFGWIALAYIRREVADGDAVAVIGESGAATARVSPLPFA